MERIVETLIFLSFVAHLIILVTSQDTSLITKICNQTPNPNLCASTLNSDPGTLDAKNEADLANIMVLQINYTAVETNDHISDGLEDEKVDEPTKQLLRKCSEQYNQITTHWLTATMDGLSAKNYVNARDSMNNVKMNVESCEASFKEPVKSPISTDSQAMDDLSKIALTIVSLLA